MTRSELISKLAERNPDLSPIDVKVSVAAIIDRISATLAAGGRVEVRGFGTLRVSERPPRKAHNPRTGIEIELPWRRGIIFKPAAELRERVNTPQRQILSFKRKTQEAQRYQDRQAA